MVTAPAPVVIFTSPAASKLVRSVTFSTACFAVGEHTPAAQLMFCVAFVEIVTDASHAGARTAKARASDKSCEPHSRQLPKDSTEGEVQRFSSSHTPGLAFTRTPCDASPRNLAEIRGCG